MIDLIAEIVVVLAFLIALVAVPAWASGLIPGKTTPGTLPSDADDQPEAVASAPVAPTHQVTAGDSRDAR